MSEIALTTIPETPTEIEQIRNGSVVEEVTQETSPMYEDPRQEMMGFILNPKGLAEFERKLSRTLTGSTETDIFVPIFEEVVTLGQRFPASARRPFEIVGHVC